MKNVMIFLAKVAIMIIFALLGATLLVEWMVGCGETYVDSKGVTHRNECVFIK